MKSTIILTALIAITALAQQPVSQQTPGEKLAPYYPTPETIAERMLEAVQLSPGEKMFDVGSGDGRIVILAAQKFHAQAVGVELDNDLWISSDAKIRKLGLEKNASIIHGDLLAQDYSSANVITVYLLPDSNLKLRPILDAQLKKGTRVVAHDFEIGGWTPTKTITIADDGEGRSHTLFLYIK